MNIQAMRSSVALKAENSSPKYSLNHTVSSPPDPLEGSAQNNVALVNIYELLLLLLGPMLGAFCRYLYAFLCFAEYPRVSGFSFEILINQDNFRESFAPRSFVVSL